MTLLLDSENGFLSSKGYMPRVYPLNEPKLMEFVVKDELRTQMGAGLDCLDDYLVLRCIYIVTN